MRPPDDNVSWFVPACLSSETGTVGQLHKFTWKLAIRPSNVDNPLNKQFHNGGWEHGPHSFLKSTLDGRGGAKECRHNAPVASAPVDGAGTQWIGVAAGPACSLFNIPTELSRLHTPRFAYSGIMDKLWSGSDSGTMRPGLIGVLPFAWREGTNRVLPITCVEHYGFTKLLVHTTKHRMRPSCDYSRSEVWRLTYFRMSLYTESTYHIRSHNNSQIRHQLLQFIFRSTKEIPVKEKGRRTENNLSFSLMSQRSLPRR